MKVALIEYGAGNVASVERALRRLGATTERVGDPLGLAAAQAAILPGVGHFAALMRGLDARSLRAPLAAALRSGLPFLGICLGLQALYEASEEAPAVAGLALLAGRIKSLPPRPKLPHMGWNQIDRERPSRLLEGIPGDAYFYFAHSFAALTPDEAVVATCRHGVEFVAALERENLFAVQFHPEKSGEVGAELLRNFLRSIG
jgi:imidazole glycerol phosphate synthase glutamine amidotransferase subunit